jgi:hypothetical protein
MPAAVHPADRGSRLHIDRLICSFSRFADDNGDRLPLCGFRQGANKHHKMLTYSLGAERFVQPA